MSIKLEYLLSGEAPHPVGPLGLGYGSFIPGNNKNDNKIIITPFISTLSGKMTMSVHKIKQNDR